MTTGLERATLMRIFVDESHRYGNKPLFMAIVDELRLQGFAGATVLKGIAGFGIHQVLHSLRAIEVATDLPVLIEVAEADEKVRAVIPRLRDMIPAGLITLEKITMQLIRRPAEGVVSP